MLVVRTDTRMNVVWAIWIEVTFGMILFRTGSYTMDNTYFHWCA